jgi:predicted RNase H-like HicB family nuclease
VRAALNQGPERSRVAAYDCLVATNTLQMTILYEEGEDGWTIASVSEVPGTHSQGRTREEARANVVDALEVMLTRDDDLADRDRESLVLTIVR